MAKADLSFGDALLLGSAFVPTPHNMSIERCGIGMIYRALGVNSTSYSTINLIYPGIVDKAWPCPWCADKEEVQSCGLVGACVVRHPFSEHYLTRQISIEDLADWLDYISTDPNWIALQQRIRTMPKFSSGTQMTGITSRRGNKKPKAFERYGIGAAAQSMAFLTASFRVKLQACLLSLFRSCTRW